MNRFEKAGTVKEVLDGAVARCLFCHSVALTVSFFKIRIVRDGVRVTGRNRGCALHALITIIIGTTAITTTTYAVRYSYIVMGCAADVEKALTFNRTMLGSRCVERITAMIMPIISIGLGQG